MSDTRPNLSQEQTVEPDDCESYLPNDSLGTLRRNGSNGKSMLDSAMQFFLSCFYFFDCLIRLHAFHDLFFYFLICLRSLNFKRLKVRRLTFERLAV